MSKYQSIIGRFEHVDIIDKLDNIPAKIDTGAYRASIHASDIKVIKKGKKELLTYTMLGHPAHPDQIYMQTTKYTLRKVRSSNGQMTERYTVALRIRLGYKVFGTEFTLADRSNNIFPVLIGRRALNKRFLVDPDKSGVNRLELQKATSSVPEDKEYIEGVPR